LAGQQPQPVVDILRQPEVAGLGLLRGGRAPPLGARRRR
jgi:hypothetical protein